MCSSVLALDRVLQRGLLFPTQEGVRACAGGCARAQLRAAPITPKDATACFVVSRFELSASDLGGLCRAGAVPL